MRTPNDGHTHICQSCSCRWSGKPAVNVTDDTARLIARVLRSYADQTSPDNAELYEVATQLELQSFGQLHGEDRHTYSDAKLRCMPPASRARGPVPRASQLMRPFLV